MEKTNFKKGDLVGFKITKIVEKFNYECGANPDDLVKTCEFIQLANVIGKVDNSSVVAIEYGDNIRVVKASELINVLSNNN